MSLLVDPERQLSIPSLEQLRALYGSPAPRIRVGTLHYFLFGDFMDSYWIGNHLVFSVNLMCKEELNLLLEISDF